MIASRLKDRTAVLLSSFCILGTLTFLPAAAGQTPVAEREDGRAKVAAGKQGETDKDKLQGQWQIMSITVEGKTFKREDNLPEWRETFHTDLLIQGDRLAHGKQTSKGKFTLDDSRNPKQITIRDDEGKLTFRGIYDIDADALKVCINGNGTDDRRPEEFATKKGMPLVLITLKRSPAKK